MLEWLPFDPLQAARFSLILLRGAVMTVQITAGALAVAMASWETLDHRVRKSDEYRSTIFAALRKLPGMEPEHTYPKAKRVSLYGGLKVVYHGEELGGLSIAKFVEALRAEGAPVKWGFRECR